jgi:hypothetical protein
VAVPDCQDGKEAPIAVWEFVGQRIRFSLPSFDNVTKLSVRAALQPPADAADFPGRGGVPAGF